MMWFKRRRQSCPSDDEVLRTGVRFPVGELMTMADKVMLGTTPPPLSFNEMVLLDALIRQRLPAPTRRTSEVPRADS